MTVTKANISLITISSRLPAEGRSWINGLGPEHRCSTEYILNLVGADNFVKHWQTYRDDQIRLENDFG